MLLEVHFWKSFFNLVVNYFLNDILLHLISFTNLKALNLFSVSGGLSAILDEKFSARVLDLRMEVDGNSALL
jgi:hypothetical protein